MDPPEGPLGPNTTQSTIPSSTFNVEPSNVSPKPLAFPDRDPPLFSEMSSSVSPAIEHPKVRFQSTIDRPVEWPLEHFPQPPLDGYWIPKFAPPPPSKFPSPLPNVPSKFTLDPPIMALTYPPPLPLTVEDSTWLDTMLADVMRQRAHLETCLSEAQADVANAYVEAGLADAELEEERAKMQTFLNLVASVAGTGFVRRMLEDVEHSVEVMSKPPSRGNDHDSGDGSTSSSSGSPNGVHPSAI
ncbi:hypothetical protein JVT61DRAFT_7709 [Boletus reticuloceps]|uniref:Uncharacterized protein n=1 Tax=Boletus reticuloceps TaxID=495285 RepID=A0A8I2YIA1_9AGAM|nr:hypothetical protein JVT61DRAFT_7709 [Boletus reticuloceps]